MDKEYMTLKEVAEYYKVHDNTVRNWVANSEMPFIKKGRILRFDIEIVEKWFNNKK